jgi:hypothetical protein
MVFKASSQEMRTYFLSSFGAGDLLRDIRYVRGGRCICGNHLWYRAPLKLVLKVSFDITESSAYIFVIPVIRFDRNYFAVPDKSFDNTMLVASAVALTGGINCGCFSNFQRLETFIILT